MNKLTYIIISIFALLFVGCDNEGDKLAEITGQAASLSISSTDTNVQIENDGLKGTVVFKTAGGQSRIAVETNQRVWIVDNPGNQWLKIEQDETGLTLSVDVNSGEQALNTSVTITAGSGENTVKAVLDVNQRASGDPELSFACRAAHSADRAKAMCGSRWLCRPSAWRKRCAALMKAVF